MADHNPKRPKGGSRKNYAAIRNRINTREASTLTFSTVAASASLVTLSLSLNNTRCVPLWNGLLWAGLLFAILGIGYREITIFYEDMHDFEEIMEDEEPHPIRQSQIVRAFLVRLFLAIPLFAWTYVAFGFGYAYLILFACLLAFLIIMQCCEHVKRSELRHKWLRNIEVRSTKRFAAL